LINFVKKYFNTFIYFIILLIISELCRYKKEYHID
jgi:hypothetical protein